MPVRSTIWRMSHGNRNQKDVYFFVAWPLSYGVTLRKSLQLCFFVLFPSFVWLIQLNCKIFREGTVFYYSY